MDSATLLYHLLDLGNDVLPLAIYYGQRHARELISARDICKRAGLDLREVNLSAVRQVLGGSSQTDTSVPVPEGHYADENMKLTIVPNRNMILLSVAIAYAVSARATVVAYGAHAGDHTIYPDCRPEFVEALQVAAHLGNWEPVELLAPFLHIDKAAILARGLELGVPYEKTWTCYAGGDMPCGRCGSCSERADAFLRNGVSDPLVRKAA